MNNINKETVWKHHVLNVPSFYLRDVPLWENNPLGGGNLALAPGHVSERQKHILRVRTERDRYSKDGQ